MLRWRLVLTLRRGGVGWWPESSAEAGSGGAQMSRQEFGGATRRARREVELAARVRSAGLQRFAVGSAIWLLAVVSTATLATWAIRSAGSQLGGANNLSLPEVSTSLAPAQGQVPALSAGGYVDLPSALPSAEASPSESTGPSSSRTVAVTTTSPALAAASTGDGGGSVMPQATTPTAPTTAPTATSGAPSPHTHPPTTSSTTSSPTPTKTATTTAIVAPSPTVSPVAGTQETDGGTVTATCTGTTLNVTAAPQDRWIVVAPVVEGDRVRTGFHKNQRTISVLITCVEGAPEFAVSD